MSHSIIRNAKYKMSNMPSVSRHNERQNKEYGNKDIDTDKSNENYHLKQPQEKSYEKEFDRLKAENHLKGNLRLTGKKQSNVACEFLITSDNEFFKRIGADETKRYFETAYKFACEKCGEKNILSAVVHMDETTPHMHLTYIPVVEGKDKKGQTIEKVNCSEFWKGFNSYGELQDKFHAYVKEHGFDLERGESRAEQREHLSVEKFKLETLKEKVNTLEQAREVYRSDLKALQDILERSKGVKATYHEIDTIEGKTGAFNRDKVTISVKDFEKLKEVAKKGTTLEYELERVKGEIVRFKNREDRVEKLAKGLKSENVVLKAKNIDLEEETTIFKRILKKGGVTDKQLDTLMKSVEKELQAEEKARLQQLKATKHKSFGMER